MKSDKELEKEIEEGVDKTIEDLKNIFPIKRLGSKSKYLIISEKKIGVLRYLMLKNLKTNFKFREKRE